MPESKSTERTSPEVKAAPTSGVVNQSRTPLPFTKLILIAFLIYCLLILVISFTIFAVYRFYIPKKVAPYCANNSTSGVEIPPAAPRPSVVSDEGGPSALLDTSTWNMYIDPHLRFSFKYPPALNVEEDKIENTDGNIITTGASLYRSNDGVKSSFDIIFNITRYSQQTFNSPASEINKLLKLKIGETGSTHQVGNEWQNEITRLPDSTVSGQKAYTFLATKEWERTIPRTRLLIPFNGFVYEIFYDNPSNTQNYSINPSIFTQILSTFRFLDTNTLNQPIVDERTYTNSLYGYTIQVPPGWSVTESDASINEQVVKLTKDNKSIDILFEGGWDHGFDPWVPVLETTVNIAGLPAELTVFQDNAGDPPDGGWAIYTIPNFHSFRIETRYDDEISQILKTLQFPD